MHNKMTKTFPAYGLIKFFSKQKYLEDLINGKVYCNTPEYYRFSKYEGVSDVNESCRVAYRKERDDDPIKVTVEGKKLRSVISATIRNGRHRDSWLHCWFLLYFSNNYHSIQKLKSDVERIKKEFGGYMAFVASYHIEELEKRLNNSSPHPVKSTPVLYTDDESIWSNKCKKSSYSYQREFRFLIGECEDNNKEPLCFSVKNGLKDIVKNKPDIKIVGNNQKVLFSL